MSAAFKLSDSLRMIRNIKTTGMVVPSSRVLVRELLKPIDFTSTTCIVEFGPGNGCTTYALLEQMNADSTLLSLELNEVFAARLARLEDPRLHVYNVCASSIREILDAHDVALADYVVSFLPLALMDDASVASILAGAAAILHPGGCFQQYQYSLANYRDVKNLFRDVKLKFILRNIPPAFIYQCIK